MFQMLNLRKVIYILIALSTLFVVASFALQNDSKERMIILSDTTVYDHKTGITVFEGHVKVTQGSSHLTADRLMTKSGPNHKINEIIAYGTTVPAHFWTLSKENGTPFDATANIIKYFPNNPSVTLEQNVTVSQGKNSFHGGVIHYNRLTETLVVPESNAGRAVLIYNPEAN